MHPIQPPRKATRRPKDVQTAPPEGPIICAMPVRPSPADVRRARKLGVCPWCHHAIEAEGRDSDLCPGCGHNTVKPLGPPDPGTPGRARLALFLSLALITSIAIVQQLGGSILSAKSGAQGPGEPPSPPSAQFEITAKVFTKVQRTFPDPKLKRRAVEAVDDQSREPEDKLRAAILAGDLLGQDEAVQRLTEIEAALAPESPLVADCLAVRSIYAGESPDEPTRQRLKKHHGWFGELAASHGLPESDPERERLLGGGGALLVMTGLVGIAVVGAMIAGFVLLIIAIVRGAAGTLTTAFTPPTPGGSLAIEMVAVFVLGFLFLKGASALAESYWTPRQALWFGLVAQWMLLAVVLWPRFVGAGGGRGLALIGWHKGEGVLKEVGCGLVGYLACLPLLFVGAVVSITLVFLYSIIQQAMTGQSPPPPTNPILDIASGKAGVWVVVMVYLLASLWAPIVEETIFRGCLYRHMRSRWHWLPAGLFTALCFGVMHGYPILMLGPVMALGFGFSLLREWRGSLIAPMTAHCFHNATVLALVLCTLRLVG